MEQEKRENPQGKYRHKNFFSSFCHAVEGLLYVVRHERNFRIQLSIAVLAVLLSLFYELSTLKHFALYFSIFFVLLMECVNTALERLVDLYTIDYHPLGKAIKDVASGCVLIASIFAVVIGVLIFLEPEPLGRMIGFFVQNPLWLCGLAVYLVAAGFFVLHWKD